MSDLENVAVIVRQYGGLVDTGVNWTWAVFPDPTRGRFAFQEVTTRYPALDHRGWCAIGFRYRESQ